MMTIRAIAATVAAVTVAAVLSASGTQSQGLSNRPDTPFKLATFEAQGQTRVGMTSGARLVDIAAANTYVSKQASLPAVAIPNDLRLIIEQYDRVAPRLYQIANYLKTANVTSLPFTYDPAAITFKAPIL